MNKIIFVIGMVISLNLCGIIPLYAATQLSDYQYQETKDLIGLVRDAANLVESKGEVAFGEFKKEGSAWKQGKVYIFILDTDGNMVVHPDPALEGRNEIDLKDANGKPITRGLIEEAAATPNKKEGWLHYQWPEPGTIFSAWKTVFARRAVSPSGKTYVVCCGLYEMKMENEFLVNAVNAAAALIEKEGKAAFPMLRDKSSQFVFLGTYIFVDTPEGIEVVNAGFPDVEGKNLLDYKDPDGKYLTRELIDIALKNGSGWVDYLWPRPGEITPSKKHTYVKKAVYGSETFIVGAGGYPDAAGAVSKEKIDNIVGKLMILELKSGDKAAGVILRETKDSLYLVNTDGSMEVSFPRVKVVKIRIPTEEENAKLKENLTEKEKTKKESLEKKQK